MYCVGGRRRGRCVCIAVDILKGAKRKFKHDFDSVHDGDSGVSLCGHGLL